jgi:hypothetical protein
LTGDSLIQLTNCINGAITEKVIVEVLEKYRDKIKQGEQSGYRDLLMLQAAPLILALATGLDSFAD